MQRTSFYWVDVIRDRYGADGRSVINTKKMIELIDTYGVNARDQDGRKITTLFRFMTQEQSNIVFDEYKFNPFIDCRYMYFYKYYNNKQGVDMIRRCLQNDFDHKYLTHDIKYGAKGMIKLKELIDLMDKTKMCFKPKYFYKIYAMFDNHKKKGTSLFNLMLENVDLNTNKKQ